MKENMPAIMEEAKISSDVVSVKHVNVCDFYGFTKIEQNRMKRTTPDKEHERLRFFRIWLEFFENTIDALPKYEKY